MIRQTAKEYPVTLYETIFTRRSVRKFDMSPLDGALLGEIGDFVAGAGQFEGQNARFEIAAAEAVKGAAAPHYILAHAGESAAAFANIGYVMQKADLYLQSIGLGSLWLGMTKPKHVKEGFCILLAFGKTTVPPRNGAGDFDRLPPREISDTDNAVAGAARLAPSAMNSQPWKLRFTDGRVIVDYVGRGLMKVVLGKKLSKIDLGIVTRHVELALLHEGKKILSCTPVASGGAFRIEIAYA
jgi:nitroreductase